MTDPESMRKRVMDGLAIKGLTQEKLAKMIGVRQPTIAQILSGERPGRKHLPAIAEAIGSTVEWMTNGTGPRPTWCDAVDEARTIHQIHANDREIPVIGLVAANNEKWGEIERPELRSHKFKKSLALVQVMGDSAYPVAFPGQYVVVDTDRPIRPDNLVVVHLHDGRALLKRYCVVPGDKDRVMLASVNIGIGSVVIERKEIQHWYPVVGVMFE